MQNTQASYPRVCTYESQSLFAELLEYKGTGSKHLTQTCEVLKAYDTELAENRDKRVIGEKKLICRINERPCAVNKCSNKRIQENIPRRVYKMIKKLSLE